MNSDQQPPVFTALSLKHRSKRLIYLTLAVVIAAIAYAYLHGIEQAQNPASGPMAEKGGAAGNLRDTPPVSVAAVTSRQGDMPVYLGGLGTVTALKTVTVRSRVDGELIKVAFTEGQSVRKGDLLAEIDPRPYQVLFKQAEGQLIRDQALLQNARLDLSRYQTLLDQDSIAAQQTATQIALVKQYEGIVEMDQSQLDNANLQLTYARITAPISGRIGLRLVDQGNIIHAADNNGIGVITQTQPVTVIFTLPEDAAPLVLNRMQGTESIEVTAFDRAGNRKLATGKVLAVDNQIDTTTGTLKLKAQFENADQTLFANQFVNIKMQLDTLKAATLAPISAIQRGAEGAFTYVIKDDNSISMRPLKTGTVNGDMVAILDGLSPDEKLVTDGADKLREGSRVKIVKLDNIFLKTPDLPNGQQTVGKHPAP